MNATDYRTVADGYSVADFTPHYPRHDDGDAASPWPDSAIAEFYAHALAASEQAAATCGELSELLDTHGEHATALLFRRLASAEAARTNKLTRRLAGRPLPPLPRWDCNWFYKAAPDQAARDLLAHRMTPRLALDIALKAGSDVMALYARYSSAADDAEVAAQIRELAAEKACLMQGVGNALAAMPVPVPFDAEGAGNGPWPMP